MERKDAVINKGFEKFLIKERKGKGFLYTDTRTKIIDGIPHVNLIGIDQNQVYVVCPYCGGFHQHNTDSYVGGMNSHCLDFQNKSGYYIEKL
jgi:hypothetical protein